MPGAAPPESDRRPILAIDTSSAQGGIALYDGQRLSQRSWPAERSHTTTVLGELHHLLDADGLGPRSLAAIAVAMGPGAFTGLRVGMGIAKGLYLATGVPLIGVPTLEATALPFACCGSPIVATIAAGRGRIVWAHFRASGSGVVETTPPRNGTAIELAEVLRSAGKVIIAGELDDEQVDILAGVEDVSLPPRTLRSRQPSAVAEIGWRRWRDGSIDDAIALEPRYLSR